MRIFTHAPRSKKIAGKPPSIAPVRHFRLEDIPPGVYTDMDLPRLKAIYEAANFALRLRSASGVTRRIKLALREAFLAMGYVIEERDHYKKALENILAEARLGLAKDR